VDLELIGWHVIMSAEPE